MTGLLLCLAAWVAWWLLAVNWNRARSFLAWGAWMPLVLLAIAAALAWSQLAPSTILFAGFLFVPNFWWQLIAVALLLGLAFFCGWLQGVLHWAPAEINLEPAPVAHGHNGHAHHH